MGHSIDPKRVKRKGNAIVIDNTVKPVLSGHSKRDKAQILPKNGCLMEVGSIAKCNTFDLH